MKIKKPNGHWTKKRCQETALKYHIRKEFRENEYAYQTALKKGWLEDICSHMEISTKNSINYWTKEKCQEVALNYNTRKDFRENEYAYYPSFKNGWLDDICKHMQIQIKKSRGYWTKEKCKEKAKDCLSRKDFQNKYGSAYAKCRKNNWLNEICSYSGYKPHGYWTKEKCHEVTLKYTTKKECKKNNSWMYRIALENDWINDICSHMKIIGNLHKRCIYVYEFSDNHAYIGLTYNFDVRHKEHLDDEKSVVFKHILNSKSSYELKKLTDYVDVDKAKLLENKFLNKYKKNGWKILNRVKTGGLGGGRKWTKEKCHEESLKYSTRNEFILNNRPSYKAAVRYGWVNDICSHMIETVKHHGYWTKEKCHEEALKYSTRNDFSKGSVNIYNICVKNKWLDDVCKHTNEKSKSPIGYWTKEKCHEEALKYKNRSEFQKKSGCAYYFCLNNKWLDNVCSHMISSIKPKGYWTKEKCQEESLKYNKKSIFRLKSNSAYQKSKKKGWLKEICNHMI